MPIDPSLSLQVKTFEPPNPLNQLAQVSQIQAAQRQGELSQMQLDELKNDRLEMQKFQQELAAKGGPVDLNQYADMLLKSPKHMQMGLELKQKLVDQQKYDAYLRSKGVLPAAPMPVAAPAAAPNMLGAEEAIPPPVNALAPAPAPVVNALAAPPIKPVVQPVAQTVVRPADTEESIMADIRGLSASNDPRAKAEVDVLKKKLENLQRSSSLIREYNFAKTPEGGNYKGTLAEFKVLATPKTSVSVNTSTEKKYGEQFAGKLADADIAKMTTAEKAPELADNANRVLSILNKGNVFTGSAADIKLNIARALNMVGANNGETIANTEMLVAGLARNTLGAVKSSGLGSGQGFTDKDLKFLQDAEGGRITLNANTLRQLAELSHKAAEGSANAWNKRVKEMPASAREGTGLSMEPVQVAKRVGSAVAAPANIDALLNKYK